VPKASDEEEWRSGKEKVQLRGRSEVLIHRPTERVSESFFWFQSRSRTIGVQCGAERISVKKKIDGVNQKHDERENV